MEACLCSSVGKVADAIVGKAVDHAVAPIARQVGYLFNCNSNIENLRSQLQQLKDAQVRVQQAVNEANWKGQEIFDDVNRWLATVNGKISEEAAMQLKEDEEKANRRCLVGLCPNFKSRYQLSKKAVKEANAIFELLKDKDRFDGELAHPLAPEGLRKDIIRPVKDFEEFESRRGAYDAVMETLKGDLSIIGVYGMGGIGKTTLAKQVYNQAKKNNLFGAVVMAAITQTPNIVNVQKEIAEKLGLKLDAESMDVRASKLRDRLKKEKSVLIILDDIWVTLDFDELGVPFGDQETRCKILMTSRKADLLKSMGSEKNVAIDVLTQGEALSLFKNMAGNIAERIDIQSTAVEITKKCAGLPIAIATLAKALKHKEELFQWEDALDKLRNPSERNFKGIPSGVYSAIELSYSFLESEDVQLTFLICSIMGHNAALEDLIIYCRGFGLFRDLNTIQKVRNRVLTLVSNFKASCLLLDSSTPGRFDIHDVVRDVAVSIASRDHHWLILGEGDVFDEQWSDDEKLQNCSLISHPHAKVSELPDELKCPNLSFFSLGGYYSSLKIPLNFFVMTQNLKVLNFVTMKFSSLPFSNGFGLLKTLRTLRLFNCDLKNIDFIGELKNLEILDLRHSKFSILPMKIGELVKLKLLNLSHCIFLKVIPPKVLSSLSKLEELYLLDTFDRWEVEGCKNPGSCASLAELQQLSHLTTLVVNIPYEKAMPNDTMFFGKLERYHISVGNFSWIDSRFSYLENSRTLELAGFELDGGIHLRQVENLVLLRVNDVMNLERIYYGEVSAGCFSQLRVIQVRGCEKLKYLLSFSTARELRQLQQIDVGGCENMTELILAEKRDEEILNFNQLKSLRLINLPSLINLCGVSSSERVDTGSNTTLCFDHKLVFPSIKEVSVDSCPELKYLFSSSMINNFKQLETLSVSYCEGMEGVISDLNTKGLEEGGGRRNNKIVFPKLHDLWLQDLPKLKRFSYGNRIEFPSLRKLRISGCAVLCTFNEVRQKSNIISTENHCINTPQYLFKEVTLPMLEELHIHGNENLEKLWPNQLADEESLPKLIEFKLDDCKKLQYVLPLSMSKRLQRLQELTIKNCELVEEIFEPQLPLPPERFLSSSVAQAENIIKFEFPQLSKLHLSRLPNLKSFYHGIHTISLRSLKKDLTVYGCDKVKVFASNFPETNGNNQQENLIQLPLFCLNKLSFMNLERCTLKCNDGMKEIWHAHGHAHMKEYFPRLEAVDLKVNLKENSYMAQSLISLPNLERLNVCIYSDNVDDDNKNMGQSGEFSGDGDDNELYPSSSLALAFSRSTELWLYMVDQLRYLWNDRDGFIFQNNIGDHGFINLVKLHVSFCNGMVKLVTPSIAKSVLVHLQEIKIEGCKNLEEIIDEDQQGEVVKADQSICFPQLKFLQLWNLRKLESFSSSVNHTFQFPSLQTVQVYECPNMKMFSPADPSTPSCFKVLFGEFGMKECYSRSLNRTVQEIIMLGKQNSEEDTDWSESEEEVQSSEEDEDNPSTSNTNERVVENSEEKISPSILQLPTTEQIKEEK